MGVLLRGAEERFNPQIHTEGNSLTTLMKKDFAIKRKSFDLFKKYNKFQSWMYYTGRVNQGIRKGRMKAAGSDLNDNAYRIAYEGMDILPAYSFGAIHVGAWIDAGNPTPDMTGNGNTNAGSITAQFDNVETNTLISVAVKHDPDNGIFGDKFNPNDTFSVDGGLGVQIIIAREGRRASTGDHFVYDGKTIGPKEVFSTDHFADGLVLTETGSRFGEGSLKGSQRSARNKWRINYSFITRYTLTMTGSAKKQKIADIYNSDSPKDKAWEFAEVLRGEKIFRMLNEQALRYSRISMDPSSHAWYENYGSNKLTVDGFQAESGIEAPVTGNGWIPEIQDNATFDYNPNNGLSHKLIESITNILATRSPQGNSGNTFLAIGDRIGRAAFDAGMKQLMQFDQSSATSGASNIVYNVATGEKLQLGFEVTTYQYLGNKFVYIEDELLNHPGLYDVNGGLVGTGNIYIINATDVDGVPNFEVLSRQGRDLIKKNVNGMHSFDPAGEASNTAATGFDGCQIHMLSELMAVLYDTQSCGILKANSSWTGGELAGHALAGQSASSFTF
jgi:hypothetical protein